MVMGPRPLEERPPAGNDLNSKSYLVVRFSAIGDCVMAAHVATAIRKFEPRAYITWAGETRCMPVIDRRTLVDRTVEFPRDDWEAHRWSPSTWRDQMRTFARLRAVSYDFGIDLHGYAKTAICLRLAKPKLRLAAFSKDAFTGLLNPLAKGDPDRLHRVERMLEALNELTGMPPVSRPIMPEPKPLPAWEIDPTRPLVSIATGAGAKNKQYPAERWAEIGRKLIAQGIQVALLGAKSDPKVEVAGAINFVGALNLFETMSIVAGSQLHLAADTGTGHMAAAYGTPFVSIFGPTNEKHFRPYSDDGIVLKEGESTSAVTVEQVLAAVDKLGVRHGRAISH